MILLVHLHQHLLHPILQSLRRPTPATAAATTTPDNLYQLLVRSIVKASINQRDTSAETLSTAVFSGNSFDDIMKAVWVQHSSHVEKQAVKTDGKWTVARAVFAEWPNLLQFKAKKLVVDSSKSESAWNQWIVGLRGTAVALMIYEYGMAIATAKDREEFMKTCILPEERDRAGATAESSLREFLLALRQTWGTTFQAPSVVWMMWANHITRNLNRSTWQDDIASPHPTPPPPPPTHVENLLEPAESRLEAHLTGASRSASVALDCVRASIADCQQLLRHLEATARCLEDQEQRLVAREAIIEGMIRDLVPPSPSAIIDPLPLIENFEDTNHAE